MSVKTDSKMAKKRHLVQRIKRSDTEAFRELFEIYQRDIFNFLHFKLGNIEAAEDFVQDVFIKIWERRGQLRENTSIKSFLFTIARHVALNHLRHNKIVLKFQMEQTNKVSAEQAEYLEFERIELQNVLMRAIINLPLKSRIIFMMNRFEELTYNEIADRLNVSVKTVESHMGQGVKAFTRILAGKRLILISLIDGIGLEVNGFG